jgi:uncharacterized membrane protein YuzA (DUF378 family)
MERTPLDRKIKMALDETRLLLLGAQILLGFQLSGTFHELFGELTAAQRHLHAVALLCMVAAMAFLVAPTMRHRLVEHGHVDSDLVHYAGLMAGIALLPFALSLGIDHYNVFAHLFGGLAGVAAGLVFFIAAIACWYVLAYALSPERKRLMTHKKETERSAPLIDRVDHMLTEARVVLPGAQALLGFQLSVVLMRSFENLPEQLKVAHAIALGLVAISIILLMAPAAIHRIGFGGEETEEFYHLGSNLVVAATVPLAAGITLDVYVASVTAMDHSGMGVVFAALTFVLLLVLWYLLPLFIRAQKAEAGG